MSRIAAGAVIDQYELIRVIGQGGFGTVWMAYSKLQKSHFAFKILNAKLSDVTQKELEAIQTYKKLVFGGTSVG